MIKRIVEVSQAAYLQLQNRQLVVTRKKEVLGTVPVEDLGLLILEHPAITCSQQLLAACCENNVAVVLCDGKHLPGALMLPLAGNSLHSRVLAQQVQAGEGVRKRLWQAVVKAKIHAQGKVLETLTGNGKPLPAYAERVKAGDPENLEAQAARIYWPRLFGKAFRRDTDGEGINSLLNYGYAILRAATARAVVGTGLHPALGIHHHNQYDNFCLADDLMEPLRPLVDETVFRFADKIGKML